MNTTTMPMPNMAAKPMVAPRSFPMSPDTGMLTMSSPAMSPSTCPKPRESPYLAMSSFGASAGSPWQCMQERSKTTGRATTKTSSCPSWIMVR